MIAVHEENNYNQGNEGEQKWTEGMRVYCLGWVGRGPMYNRTFL